MFGKLVLSKNKTQQDLYLQETALNKWSFWIKFSSTWFLEALFINDVIAYTFT